MKQVKTQLTSENANVSQKNCDGLKTQVEDNPRRLQLQVNIHVLPEAQDIFNILLCYVFTSTAEKKVSGHLRVELINNSLGTSY